MMDDGDQTLSELAAMLDEVEARAETLTGFQKFKVQGAITKLRQEIIMAQPGAGDLPPLEDRTEAAAKLRETLADADAAEERSEERANLIFSAIDRLLQIVGVAD